jgi:glutamate racemase
MQANSVLQLFVNTPVIYCMDAAYLPYSRQGKFSIIFFTSYISLSGI